MARPNRTTAINLEQLGRAVMAVCDRNGEVLGCSPAAAEVLAEINTSSKQPRFRLPMQLWQLLAYQDDDEDPVEWTPGNGDKCLGVSRYPLDDGRWLVSMREISSRKRNLSQQVYRGTMHVSAGIVAQAAHDLRSPLSSMTFNAAVLRKRWRELPPHQVDDKLAEISACCEWQEHSIASLVEVGYSSRNILLDLGDLFDRLTTRLRPVFRSGDNQLVIEVDRGIKVKGTRFTLEHIFSNLIMNAVEATAAPVTVAVHSPRRNQLRGATVPVRVQDNGPGIPEEIRNRIFDPFFSTKIDGTGVGLCMAREAARQIGGDLRLLPERSSRAGGGGGGGGGGNGGTCFEVRLQVGEQ